MKITDILRAEHSVFHNIFDHIENTLPHARTLAEIKSLAALVARVMSPHTDTEDELFIGPLEHCIEQLGQSEMFHEEHEIIEQRLADAGNARTVNQARELLLGAIAMSREHFDKEERIVFPLAENILKTKTLTDLGNQWMKQRESMLSPAA